MGITTRLVAPGTFLLGILLTSLALPAHTYAQILPDRARPNETAPELSHPFEQGGPSPYIFTRTDADPVRLEVLGGVTAPLGPEIGLRLVIARRLILGGSFGMLTFGTMFQQIAEDYGAGAPAAGARWIDGGISLRTQIGVRLFEDLGLELMLGYAGVHREAQVGQSIAEISGTTGSFTNVVGSLSLDALTLELGYTFTILDHFLVRPAIGVFHVLGATASATTTSTNQSDLATIDDVTAQVESALETYGTVPTVSVQIGYRF